MTEHKLSESELQQIREEAEKLYPLRGILGLNSLEIKAHITAATAERLRAKGLVREAVRIGVNIGMGNAVPDDLLGVRWDIQNMVKEANEYIATLDESPSPSEAGDAPFCQWCGCRKRLKGDGTIELLCTC